MAKRRWFSKKARPKKLSFEEKYTNAINHFKVDGSVFEEDNYIFGFDLSGGRNFGWCVFQIKNGEAEYVSSASQKWKGDINEAILELYEFLISLYRKYSPVSLSCWEWALGGGAETGRSGLHECQGIVRLVSQMYKVKFIRPLQASAMGVILLKEEGEDKNVHREQKKILTCQKAKNLFPLSLSKRRISSSGQFTHESDAIGFCACICTANDIHIKTEEGEENAQ